jgi:RNA polymerase sigma-70 factor (ECF subfamily)
MTALVENPPAPAGPPAAAPAQPYHRPLRSRAMTSPTPSSTIVAPEGADAESRAWIEDLSAEGPQRTRAVDRLHELLLGAARFEINRRRATRPHLRGDDFDDLAHQAASDAMMAILGKLGDYRGESRFTTWAYKFALLEAAVKLRKRAWQGRELPIEPEQWSVIEAPTTSPARRAEQSELFDQVRGAIDNDLSEHQREVLLAVAVNGVPIDVLADRMSTTRGALYKTIHDARKKLRARLEELGAELEHKEAGE